MADPAYDPFAALGAIPVAPTPSAASGPVVNSPAGYAQPLPNELPVAPPPDPAAPPADPIVVSTPIVVSASAPRSAPKLATASARSAPAFDPFASMGATPVAANENPPPVATAPVGKTGMAANVGAGLAEGAGDTVNTLSDPVGNLIGRPVAAGLVLAHDLVAPLLGRPKFTPDERSFLLGDTQPQIGTAAINAAASAVGAPTPDQVQPATPSEALWRTATRAATGAGALAPLGAAAGAGPLSLARSVIDAAPVGLVGGMAGQSAADAVPDEFKPLAQMAGGAAGMMGGEFAGSIATGAGRRITAPLPLGAKITLTDPATGLPLTMGPNGNPVRATPAQIGLAAQRVASGAGQDAGTLADSIPSATDAELVPGSTGTMGQVTGNTKLLGYERQLRNTPDGRASFTDAEATNNAARLAALEGLAPEDAGNAAASFVQSQMAAIRAQNEAEVQPAQQAATAATASLGGVPGTTDIQALGAAQQQQLNALSKPVKSQAQRLYDALDPKGDLALDASSVGAKAAEIREGIGLGGALAPAEREPLEAAATAHGVIPFSALRDLASNTGEALRAIRRDPQLGAESKPYRRMSMLMDSIQSAMVEAGKEKATQEAAAVQTGQMTPEQTMLHSLNQWVEAQRGAVSQAAVGTGNGGVSGARPSARGGTSPDVGAFGAAGQARGGAGYPQGTAGLPGETQPLTANFIEANRRDLVQANMAYAAYKQQFRTGAVGEVLQSGALPSGFKTAESAVPGKIFKAGPDGATAMDSLIRAAGSPEAALNVLGDYPAFMLRRAAEKDGTLDPAAYERWRTAFKPALDKIPDLAAQFKSAAQARVTLDETAARAQQRLQDVQDSAFRHYLGRSGEGADTQVATNSIMTSDNPAREVADLMTRAKGDIAATDGIRRNMLDWILAKTRATTEAGTSGQKEIAAGVFQRTIATPKIRRAFEEAFTPQQMFVFDRVGQDLERAARAYNGVKIPGSPGTAADLHALGDHGSISMLMQAEMGEKMGEVLSHAGGHASGAMGAIFGAAGMVGATVLGAARAAGYGQINKVATQMVLHPELGRALLQRAVPTPKAGALTAALSRLALTSAVSPTPASVAAR